MILHCLTERLGEMTAKRHVKEMHPETLLPDQEDTDLKFAHQIDQINKFYAKRLLGNPELIHGRGLYWIEEKDL